MNDGRHTVPKEPRHSAATSDQSLRQREIEGTLLVTAEVPSLVQQQLAALRSIGRYMLLKEKPRRIRDVYLDLPARPLARQKIGFRLRSNQECELLTLKADSKDSDTVSDRMEIEAVWSPHALGDILGELAQHGISVPLPAGVREGQDALTALAKLGFEPVQVRDLERVPRTVILSSDSAEPLAEMDIDIVTYSFDGTRIRIYEVEVEAKRGDRSRIVEEVTAALLATFPANLRRWRYGKFPTGVALHDLLLAGDLSELIDSSGVLDPLAYEVVDDALGDCGGSIMGQSAGAK